MNLLLILSLFFIFTSSPYYKVRTFRMDWLSDISKADIDNPKKFACIESESLKCIINHKEAYDANDNPDSREVLLTRYYLRFYFSSAFLANNFVFYNANLEKYQEKYGNVESFDDLMILSFFVKLSNVKEVFKMINTSDMQHFRIERVSSTYFFIYAAFYSK